MGRGIRAALIAAIVAGGLTGVALAIASAPTGVVTVGDYQAGLLTAIFGAVAFIAVYSIREPWWSNWFGRFVVSHIIAFMLLCIPFVLSLFFSLNRLDSEIAEWVLLAAFYLSAEVLLLGTILWLQTSLDRARERREAETAGTCEYCGQHLQAAEDPEPRS